MKGINVVEGHLICEPVGEAVGMACVPLGEALK
jgi:hypothetical protein